MRAGGIHPSNFYGPLTADTLKPKVNKPPGKAQPPQPIRRPDDDTTKKPISDTSRNRSDSNRLQQGPLVNTTDTFILRISKDTLDAPVKYKAEDSAVILVQEKKIILYSKTHTTYQDVVLDAPVVEIDQTTSIITAIGEKDSLGEPVVRAMMQQGDQKFESDTIRVSGKTKKGLLTNTITQQNEIFMHLDKAKKVNDNTVFARGLSFTTCDLDHPHFGFRTNKAKIINNKVAVTGPTHPEFEGVPLPIYLPFGYFPLNKGRHSGLLPPQFLATENQGIGLQGLGYYRVINEYWDATVRGDVYSYGGWLVNGNTSYRRRYRFNGAFNMIVQNTKTNFPGDPDYFATKTFNINWTHSVDQRARPGVNFSASVNAGSTKFNRYVTSSLQRNVQNQLNSSIQYSKTWIGKPFSLTMAANHNQNSETRLINVTLPDAAFTVSTLYPLQRKEQVGSAKWYEKLGIGYSGAVRNTIAFYDSAFSIPRIIDTLSWGATHALPVSLTLPPLGPLLVSPGISYQQQWIQNRTIYSWNPVAGKIDTVNQHGLYTAHNLSASLGFSTALFGTFNFRRSRIVAIRHTMRPTVSLSYTPNLARKYYRSFQSDVSGKMTTYNVYAASPNLYTGYGNQESGGIGFGLDNVLEMKLKPKNDTTNTKRNVRLIDGFGFNGGYNFLADSFKLSQLSLYLRSTLFDKLNLNFNAIMTPYAFDRDGRMIKDYAWTKGYGLGRITNGSVSLSTNFRSKSRDGSQTSTVQQAAGTRITDPTLLADQSRLLDYMRLNPTQFVDFNIPYDIGLDFALNFTRESLPDYKVRTTISSNLSFRTSFSLTPKWNFSSNGYFDVNTKKLTGLSLAINRDLHCWQMSIGLTPVGPQRYFSISISPKSGLLQNLKINRTRTFLDF